MVNAHDVGERRRRMYPWESEETEWTVAGLLDSLLCLRRQAMETSYMYTAQSPDSSSHSRLLANEAVIRKIIGLPGDLPCKPAKLHLF
jgi:hypothetical protein